VSVEFTHFSEIVHVHFVAVRKQVEVVNCRLVLVVALLHICSQETHNIQGVGALQAVIDQKLSSEVLYVYVFVRNVFGVAIVEISISVRDFVLIYEKICCQMFVSFWELHLISKFFVENVERLQVDVLLIVNKIGEVFVSQILTQLVIY